LIAKKGNEKSYLKLDDGSSLSLSRFEVDGVEVKNGIKGFIFGERGVWRPGDSLFLGCIIEDKDKKLPQEHPVEMELISPKGQLYKRLVVKN
ncbi:MG2 domain-containing protein, partial [Acinetobacter baumannii]